MPRLSSHSADMPPSTRLRVFVAAIALLACAAARPLPVAAQTTTTIAGTVTRHERRRAAGGGRHSAPRRNRPCANGDVGRRGEVHIRLPAGGQLGGAGRAVRVQAARSAPVSSTSIGERVVIDFELDVGGLTEAVTVSGGGSPVNVSSGELSYLVSGTDAPGPAAERPQLHRPGAAAARRHALSQP